MAANLGPTPFQKSIISYVPQRTQLLLTSVSIKNHQRCAMHSMGFLQGLSSLFHSDMAMLTIVN